MIAGFPLAGDEGFEPPQTESESGVLPLHKSPKWPLAEAHDYYNDFSQKVLITVTDEALLAKTGGIVQGMSGSPILQNGKLVGAVTHVLVNDPTMGYGVLIENMLEMAK